MALLLLPPQTHFGKRFEMRRISSRLLENHELLSSSGARLHHELFSLFAKRSLSDYSHTTGMEETILQHIAFDIFREYVLESVESHALSDMGSYKKPSATVTRSRRISSLLAGYLRPSLQLRSTPKMLLSFFDTE